MSEILVMILWSEIKQIAWVTKCRNHPLIWPVSCDNEMLKAISCLSSHLLT